MKSKQSELTLLRWKNGRSDPHEVVYQPSHLCNAPGRTPTMHLYDQYDKWKNSRQRWLLKKMILGSSVTLALLFCSLCLFVWLQNHIFTIAFEKLLVNLLSLTCMFIYCLLLPGNGTNHLIYHSFLKNACKKLKNWMLIKNKNWLLDTCDARLQYLVVLHSILLLYARRMRIYNGY